LILTLLSFFFLEFIYRLFEDLFFCGFIEAGRRTYESY